MGISNLSTGLRPGVCTSTTRPSTPFEGQMIYETDTNRVLVYEGAAWVMIADTDTPPGMVLIKTQTIGTTVASITVTNAFSTDFDNYKIIITGGTTSAQSNIFMQLTNITGIVYNQLGYYQQYGSGTMTGYAANATSVIVADGSATAYCADVELKNPALTTRKFGNTMSQSSADQYSFPFYINSTTSSTGFTLTIGTGTFTGGNIRVYGYRNTI